ncbi:hypothetical protein [Pulveribacter sp.]|uniref:hypothetical protein n=1 Tax=Pulveribacter sp. TaxID=2678893 RepID=UPI0028AA09C0|nr:hypothetical protein [Pulveribacter sp.]
MSDAAAAQPPLALAILRELAQPGLQDGLALPALSKRLGLGASAVLRQLSALGDAPLGGGARPRLGVRVARPGPLAGGADR